MRSVSIHLSSDMVKALNTREQRTAECIAIPQHILCWLSLADSEDGKQFPFNSQSKTETTIQINEIGLYHIVAIHSVSYGGA